MKGFFTIAVVMLLPIFVYAQKINGIPLSEIKSPNLLIAGVGQLFSNKVTVEIDFGQEVDYSLFPSKKMQLFDEKGEIVVFNSMIDALNFFEKYGYELKNAYAVNGGVNNRSCYHWLLRKKELIK
jgi:SNF family Na+-dependent transporter